LLEIANRAVVLSFDIEEHHRIEAAAHLTFTSEQKAASGARMEAATRAILAQLAAAGAPATFYIVGEIALSHPKLVSDIAGAGHEIGSHSWDHRRVHRLTPDEFREDLRRSIDTLRQVAGVPVLGYRAPTFSVMSETAWAADVLAESGLKYDSSIFPVRHDRYGVPDAPRMPFWLRGERGRILELPPATYRRVGMNLPVAGGGYFRLFPQALLRAGVNQLAEAGAPAVLYFHPWEFDPGQPKLPLRKLSRYRTYVGISKSAARLDRLLTRYRGRFRRALDVANDLAEDLPEFRLA
jgi:polysaccharide deacetylase family protein (PEP-CTERM system associated)